MGNWLVPTALTVASGGTEISRLPLGPAPLLLAIGAVFLSGIRIGRWMPFVFAAVNVAILSAHLGFLAHAHAPVVDGGPPWVWRCVIAVIVLTIFALASALTAGSLEDAKTRADALAYHNAALADTNAHLQALTTADPLTGLLNHRGLVGALDAALDAARRAGQSCALLFVDIDHFKALNDGYGHAAGDAILQEFARLLRDNVRGVDLLGRWGGEEFVILLPEMDSEGAETAAERVRAGIAAHVFPTSGGLRLSCSIGLAVFPENAVHRGELLDAADRAMYAAKRLGRNQVRSAGDPAVEVLLMDIVGNGTREEAAAAGTVEALAMLVAARDGNVGKHSQDVADLALRMADALGFAPAEARMVGLAGRLHNIGKVGVPDAILHKAGRLTEDEWAVIRRHPLLGADIVGHAPMLRALAPLIRSHHERWDGGGYPDGLSREAIPLGARVLTVADAFLAMTSDRPYHRAWEETWALDQIERQSGTQFDPRVVAALRAVLPAPPDAPAHDTPLAHILGAR